MNTSLESFFDLLKLATRQRTAFLDFFSIIGGFFKSFSFKSVTATITLLAELLGCVLFDTPVTPHGQTLDLSGYELVFCDEFTGSELDLSVWRHRGVGARRCGFNAATQTKAGNGQLVITAEYRNKGVYGSGWYTGAVALNQKYKQGYYEIRCKCNGGVDFWSAFWIQADHPYDHELSQGGVGGAEIDIFESINGRGRSSAEYNAVTSTVHCNGHDDDPEHIDSNIVGSFKVGNDISANYNTYGLEWTEDEYIFYINGVESGRTSFGSGVSRVEEEVIVSLEIPDEVLYLDDYSTCMIVDYVKIYQKP